MYLFCSYRSLEEMEKNLQHCTDDADAGLNKQRKLRELELRLFQLCDNKVTKIAAASIEEEEEEEKVEEEEEVEEEEREEEEKKVEGEEEEEIVEEVEEEEDEEVEEEEDEEEEEEEEIEEEQEVVKEEEEMAGGYRGRGYRSLEEMKKTTLLYSSSPKDKTLQVPV